MTQSMIYYKNIYSYQQQWVNMGTYFGGIVRMGYYKDTFWRDCTYVLLQGHILAGMYVWAITGTCFGGICTYGLL